MKRTSLVLVLALSAIVPVVGSAVTAANATAIATVSTTAPIAQTIATKMARTLKTGRFIALEHPTAGMVRVIANGNQTYIELGNDFRSDSGPDLQVVLHKSATPGMKFNAGDYMVLAPLQKTTGTQRYNLPRNVNLNQYRSVAIWCQQFNATFGAATLN
ncbi:MAG: electron transfer flavoprotein [Oscillatoriales cyanobacterium]|nr:MAG: electron transfer flavoprotein [Oscillatoriales cyanobacterium]